ncbi:hypothetical protein [uncultured Chitinophaga sp.]|jgi:hypothetical protein|uniref:hypothetical protein n=1 Tax=uncultured Chitinophaga sp. TaxID=339340 RepID=UPI00261263F1|nr:hypothetical protein [uncultured Chitinophaga sp.]
MKKAFLLPSALILLSGSTVFANNGKKDEIKARNQQVQNKPALSRVLSLVRRQDAIKAML